jgi:hypothetical protein
MADHQAEWRRGWGDAAQGKLPAPDAQKSPGYQEGHKAGSSKS